MAVIAIVALRVPFSHGDLLKSDEAIYAVEARAWSNGLLPGRDVWDNKPPGMAALYLLASHLPGGTIAGTRLLALLFSVVSLLLTLRLSQLVAPNLPAYPVAIAYVLITHANGWPPGEWIVLNGELPSTCFVTLAAWCLAEWAHRREQYATVASPASSGPWVLVLLAGLFSGAGMLFRQTALLPVAAMAVWLIWATSRRGALKPLGTAALGVALAWVPLVYYFWSQGALHYLWAAIGGHGLAYASQSVAMADAWRSLREGLGVGVLPELLVLALIGLAFAISKSLRLRRQSHPAGQVLLLLSLVWGLGSLLSVLPGGHLFGHYFLQLAPAWALAAGLGVARMMRFAESRVVRLAAYAAIVLGLLVLAGRLVALQPAGAQIACLWLVACLGAFVVGNLPRESTMAQVVLAATMLLLALSVATGVATDGARSANREAFTAVAAQIQARTTPSDRIVVWAWAPQVYWYSERLPACRDLTLNYSLGWIGQRPGELFPGARAAFLDDLDRTRPRMIAVANDDLLPYTTSLAWKPAAAPEIWAFIHNNYRVSARLPHWDLYELKPKRSPAQVPAIPRPEIGI
ncbi:MAG: hypothetical protein ABFD96_20810 [Armatimonadia bacterium]